MQRRTDDSRGNRGKVETLQAQPKRLNCLPAGKRPTAAKRNGPLFPLHPYLLDGNEDRPIKP
ncbi:hypothetical protein [Rossellomorea marisflavi]|uniref:hypothetical protein n=1 Tax=Rossellomorea marisflavi TaxID=189381 RepID=UPI001364A6E1|nr:hypothetical protein [Rossellomorea marisflavi]